MTCRRERNQCKSLQKELRILHPIFLIWLACASLSTHRLAGQEPEILAELAQDRIYLGESVEYNVTLNHIPDSIAPTLDGFDEFKVRALGQSPINFRHESIINGRRTVVERRGVVHRFLLTPQSAGIIELPAPKAVVNGRALFGNVCRLQVREIAAQDIARLDLSVDRDHAYLTQPFAVTLTVVVKSIGGTLTQQNPMEGLRREPPRLTIDWADDEQLPSGLKPAISDEQWLLQFRSRTSDGFSINNVRAATSLFDMGFDLNGRAMHFLPAGKKVTRDDAAGNPADYWEFEFRRNFTAHEVGQLQFGPVSLRGTFATNADRRGQVQGEEIMTVSPSVAITILDAPTEARPVDFTGGVGQFTIASELVPRTAHVGDPLTLTFTVQGQGTLDRVGPPDIATDPQIAQQFRLYESTSDTQDDTKTFTYSLRPNMTEITEFPSVAFSYFDVQQEKYVTLRTAAIPLEIAAAERLSAEQIQMTERSVPVAAPLQSNPSGIYANITNPRSFVDQRVRPAAWIAAAGGLAGVYGAVCGLAMFRERRQRDGSGRSRRNSALPRAEQNLFQAFAEASANSPREASEKLARVFTEFTADVTRAAGSGLTTADTLNLWRSHHLPDATLQRLQRLLDRCDANRFGAAALDNDQQAEAAALLRDLAAAARERKLLR